MSLFNARSETLLSSPLWKRLVHHRRCVLVIDGFFEWKMMRGGAPDTEKQPHFVRRRDGELLYLACLYDVWQPPNASLAADAGNEDADDEIALAEPLHSFTIITMRASREMRFLHDRMPCVLPDETAVDCWLSDKPFDQVHQVLQPYPVDKLEIYQVSPLVNQPRTQRGPDCIMPVDEHRRKRGIAAVE